MNKGAAIPKLCSLWST